MEEEFPGLTSFMLSQCPVGEADAVSVYYSTEELFGIVTEGVDLDFDHCCGLLDLSVEVKRQATERQRLYESFTDPHPNIIFGRLKHTWFSQLVYQRITSSNYHVTFVSSVRFIEVSFCSKNFEYLFSVFQSLDDGPFHNPLETMHALEHAFLDNADMDYETLARQHHLPPASSVQTALEAAGTADEPGMFESDYESTEEGADYQADLEGDSATTMLMREVTSPAYVMPRRIRSRIPSGPYRILSADELATIEK